ncbi:MAG: metal-dependent hydrolase [Candidatus Poribacteria bacterium]
MFILGHIGIGVTIVKPWIKGLSRRWFFLGAIIPDLIDKPLYYGLSYYLNKSGNELGLICGTRTFGHTALFLLMLTLLSFIKKSKTLAAITLGIATHLVLDHVGDSIRSYSYGYYNSDGLKSLLWPLMDAKFPPAAFPGILEHLKSIELTHTFWAEIIGAFLLGWDFWKQSRRREIITNYFARLRARMVKYRLRY